MNILQNIIAVMNKEEIRHYKIFINRTEKSGERKDELLFDYTRKNPDSYNEDKISKVLYNSNDKNALYRLKNRLLEDLGRSMLAQNYNSNELTLIANNILLSRLFQQKGQFKIANFYLSKAERKAIEKEYAEWLDIIYSDFIKLSHETLEINPEEYIKKRKENRNKLIKIQEIDDILAALIYRIKISQNFSSQSSKILDLLQKTINDFSKSKEVKNSSVLRFKIYDAVSRILLQQKNYVALEKYLLKTFREFTDQKLFTQHNHDTKLQMLTYLINSLFKNKKIDSSLEYADKLKEAMTEYDSFLYNKYLFYYYNSLVINYSEKNIDKAIEYLLEAKDNEVIKKLPMYTVFVYLNLAVLNFGKGSYKEALRNLVKPLLGDAIANFDEAFRLKLAVFELMIRFELKDFDYLEHKTERIKKDFKNLLKQPEYKKQVMMIQVISKMIFSDNYKKEKSILNLISDILKLSGGSDSGDADIINYSNWLKSKLS